MVFHDDLDLAVGKVRVKTGGGAAGHNGLKDIDQQVGNNYMRIRIGIHHPQTTQAVSHYVLGTLSAEDQAIIDPLMERIVQHSHLLLDNKTDYFMTRVMDA